MHQIAPDAACPTVSPDPARPMSIGIEPALRGRLPAMAAGRTLLVDFFANRCCTRVWVGDFTVGWLQRGDQRADLIALAPIDGVEVRADRRLERLLASSGPALRLGGPAFARHLAIRLERPEDWLAFLDGPLARRRPA
ncbi:MAG: hypothetical protein ACYDAK_01610 [Candidatus Limnocylindrales bacterium]